MKTITQQEVIKIECDQCHKLMEFDTIEVLFGYGGRFDGCYKNFCSDECLKNFVLDKKEVKKE